MAQDQNFSSNSGDSGNDSNNNNNKSKNTKQKKVPQRGLGVAQLERLRLEEQRNREAVQAANALANNAIGSANDLPHCPIPVPAPPALANPTASNLYRSVVGPLGPTGQITNDEMGVRGVSSWPRVWSEEFNNNNDYNNYLNGVDEKQKVDDHHYNVGFAFGPQVNLNLRYEPVNGPGLPVPGGEPQLPFQFQRPPSSPMVNGLFSSFQNQAPPIQSVNGNKSTSSWSESEDDKIAVGMKRAYPFDLESPPAPMPSFLSNFHASGSRSNEFGSSSNGPRNKHIRDDHLSLTPSPEQNPVEDKRLIGDFLKLAPPVAASTPLNSKNKHPMGYFGHQGLDLSDNRSLSSQENMRSSQAHRVGPSASTQRTFSFFPINPQTDLTSEHVTNGDEEKGEKLDLNLKL
ncbi:hypothetical protein CASFOL_002287 [Castilleja foliolosa]|uniref:Uncharacterized protein n=1 Tax=Castilleja foliolosa TaxID=1961234 RepID=A0ABD3EEJ1_9LAMI